MLSTKLIKAAGLFLNLVRCKGAARTFVISLMKVSRDDTAELQTLPDSMLMKQTGRSKRTIIYRRTAYIKWSQRTKLNLIEVTEQTHQKDSGEFSPIQYRIHVTSAVERFMSLALTQQGFDVHFNNYSLKRAIKAGLSGIAEEVAKGLPPAQDTSQQYKRGGKQSRNKTLTLSDRRRAIEGRLQANIFDWTQVVLDMDSSLESELIPLQELLQEGLNAGKEAWERRRAMP